MTASAIDLDAYFARIGFAGEASPTLETLRRLHALHPAAIPFENLAAFMGEEIPLDDAALQRKLVAQGRGGWCFEHNLLLAGVLRAIGFRLTTLAARVRWNAPPNELRPRSHMLLQVHMPDGDYIADVGFGGQVQTAPLRLVPGVEQQTSHELYRLAEPCRGEYLLESRIGAEWLPLYAFDLAEQHLPDYEVSNWYLANHPRSQFVTGIIAARVEPGARHALRAGRYTIHRPGAPSESRAIASVEDYKRTLAGPLGIRLPDSVELDRRLGLLLEAKP